MDEQLSTENRSTLATVAAFLSFPYIWIGLFLLLNWLYGGNFFGQGWGGDVVAALLCLGLLNPLAPGLISNFIARPAFLNLLARQIVSGMGCVVGLIGFVLSWVAVLYFVGRDFQLATWIFLAAPLVGGVLTFAVTAAGRGGGFSSSRGTSKSGRPPVRIKEPSPRELPNHPERRALPESRNERLPSPRRSRDQVPVPPRRSGEQEGRRSAPPRRRE